MLPNDFEVMPIGSFKKLELAKELVTLIHQEKEKNSSIPESVLNVYHKLYNLLT